MSLKETFSACDLHWMERALQLAKRGLGKTSPNPMVGAVLVKGDAVIGEGWHRRAGEPHAEIEAIRAAEFKGHRPYGATLYVTLEPCCTFGRTPPCTDAIQRAGIRRVVVAAIDPNPKHSGKGLRHLERAGIRISQGMLADRADRLNEAFNYWIVHRQPLVTVKAAMTLDGKIATVSGESKWITGRPARAWAMKLRNTVDAVLVGINTVLADDPRLTVRGLEPKTGNPAQTPTAQAKGAGLRRIILDTKARTPLMARVVTDEFAALTTIVVGNQAPRARVAELKRKANVIRAPARNGKIDLQWLLRWLSSQNVTHLLVEGGGEVNASFFESGLVQRVAFLYAPKIVCGASAPKAVAGTGARTQQEMLQLKDVKWRRLGVDLLLTARVASP